MENRKIKLEEALLDEFNRLKDHPDFDAENQKEDYMLAIEYLNTGDYPGNYDEHDLLYACIEDFELMCSDYGIK